MVGGWGGNWRRLNYYCCSSWNSGAGNIHFHSYHCRLRQVKNSQSWLCSEGLSIWAPCMCVTTPGLSLSAFYNTALYRFYHTLCNLFAFCPCRHQHDDETRDVSSSCRLLRISNRKDCRLFLDWHIYCENGYRYYHHLPLWRDQHTKRGWSVGFVIESEWSRLDWSITWKITT